MRRVKILDVTPELLLSFAQRGCAKCVVATNPLPDDAKIVGVTDHTAMNPGSEVRYIGFYVESATYPEVPHGMLCDAVDPPTFRDECPHQTGLAVATGTHAVTLTRDDLAALLYDADRLPGRRVTLAVGADGTWGAQQ